MKKIYLAVIAVLSVIPFVSYAQWTGTSPGPIYYNGGNVGVGTTSPTSLLSVGNQSKVVSTTGLTLGGDNSNIEFVGSTFGLGYGHKIYSVDPGNGAVDLRVAVRQGTTSWTDALTIRSNTGNVGIGTTTPSYKLVVNDISNNGNGYLGFSYATTDAFKIGRNNVTGRLDFTSLSGTNNYGYNFLNGYVGIGTDNPDELLSVKGTIHSQEVKVDMLNWPDYVFKSTYKLSSLGAVKSYIDHNGHLPEIPSAQEVEKNGLNLGEMNKLLLKKVEELTLYLIEKDKQLTDQQKIERSLQAQIDELRTTLQATHK